MINQEQLTEPKDMFEDRAQSTIASSPLQPSSRRRKEALSEFTLGPEYWPIQNSVLTQNVLPDNGQAEVIAVINPKGGVGKTTTAHNVGYNLSSLGYRVLVVDLDPTGNLSQGLGVEKPIKQVYDAVFLGEALPIESITENFDLAPSGSKLYSCEIPLAVAKEGIYQLRNVLLPILSSYEYILIDCPPGLGIFSDMALVASDSCLLPIQPEILAAIGIKRLIARIDFVQRELNEKLRLKGFVFTIVHQRLVEHQQLMATIKDMMGIYYNFKTVIHTNVDIPVSQSMNKSMIQYKKGSVGSKEYTLLTEELIQL
ncbi:ParA family protein [Spirosoma luteolum]